jgi:hypothetical protein
LIDLDLQRPINLERAEALERRLAKNHPLRPDVEEKIRILKSGYQGELTVKYYLGLMPNENYHIFYGLRLPIEESHFQIDALLLSPKIIIPLEAKNYSGTLTIDKLQLTQEVNQSKNIYQNPLDQSNRHVILLKYFFEKYKVPIIPIENRVVFSKPSSEIIIGQGYTEAEKKVCKAGDLLHKIGEIERYYKRDYIDQAAVKRIKTLFLKKHSPLNSSILQMFGLYERDILTGVHCPNCLFLPMEYNRKSWICPQCNTISKDAFLQTIRDYFLLINPSITNSELCRFLQLPSPRVATYIFTLSDFPFSGVNRGRIYFPKQPL